MTWIVNLGSGAEPFKTGPTIVNEHGERVCQLYAEYPTADAGMKCTVFPDAERNARILVAAPDLLSALQDALSGWRYIREHHGDLYGVGWDRVENSASAAIAKATRSVD